MITECTHHQRKQSQALLTPCRVAVKILVRPLDKVSYSAIIVAPSKQAACGCRCGSLLNSNERPHPRPVHTLVRLVMHSSERCHCKPPSARFQRAVPWPTPTASGAPVLLAAPSAASYPSCCRRSSAAVLSHAHPASLLPVLRPPCCPTPTIWPYRPVGHPASLSPVLVRLLSSYRHRCTVHAGTFIFMSAQIFHFSKPVDQGAYGTESALVRLLPCASVRLSACGRFE
jgi:hypothetical protein